MPRYTIFCHYELDAEDIHEVRLEADKDADFNGTTIDRIVEQTTSVNERK